MKKFIIRAANLAIMAVMAALAWGGCTQVEFDNPWDETGTNYKEYTLSTPPVTGGSVLRSPNKTRYYLNERVTVTATANSNYKFTGWSGASTSTSNSVILTMDKDLTLTANFETTTPPSTAYTITFNPNGGSVTPTSATTNAADGKLAFLPTPTKDGYTFNGWYTSSSGGVEVTTSYVFNGNTTIYARWTENSVTLPTVTTFADSRDNKTYKKVTIGTQTWMAENLNYDVPNNTTDVCHSNSADNCTKYGRLYNWETAKTACPSGWHLPSDAEWTALTDAVGGSSTAGGKLKSTSGWYNNGNGSDSYGFSALPGGYGISDGSFYDAGYYGLWWSATEGNAGNAWYRSMYYSYEGVYRDDDETILFSVRCVQD